MSESTLGNVDAQATFAMLVKSKNKIPVAVFKFAPKFSCSKFSQEFLKIARSDQ